MTNKTGGNTGSIEQSPRRKARRAKARRREEADWSAQAGEVIVTHVLADRVVQATERSEGAAPGESDQ